MTATDFAIVVSCCSALTGGSLARSIQPDKSSYQFKEWVLILVLPQHLCLLCPIWVLPESGGGAPPSMDAAPALL